MTLQLKAFSTILIALALALFSGCKASYVGSPPTTDFGSNLLVQLDSKIPIESHPTTTLLPNQAIDLLKAYRLKPSNLPSTVAPTEEDASPSFTSSSSSSSSYTSTTSTSSTSSEDSLSVEDREYFIIFGFIMFLVINCVYFWIVWKQYLEAKKSPQTERYSALSLRCALVVPATSLSTFIQLVYPFSFVGLLVYNSIVQVITLYSVLAMLVIFLGGPESVIRHFENKQHGSSCGPGSKPVCGLWKRHPRAFYQFIIFYHDQFNIRPVLFTVSAILFYMRKGDIGVVAIIFVICLISLVIVVLGTLQFYYLVYESVAGINGSSKTIIICISLLLVTLQSAVLEAFYIHKRLISTSGAFTASFQFAQMVEMLILILIYSIVFNFKMDFLALDSTRTDENIQGDFGANFNFWGFIKSIFRIHDMFKPTRLDKVRNDDFPAGSSSISENIQLDQSLLQAEGINPSLFRFDSNNNNNRRNVSGGVI